MTKAEYEARAACSGLGWTEEDIKSFVDWHQKEEDRRERNANLVNAIIDVAVSPWKEKYKDKDFPKDATPVMDEEYPEEARRYRKERG